jgi:Bacterial extracellular solute-binding proteins, family 5 Middle.
VKFKKWTWVLLLAAIVSLVLAGCGGSKDSKSGGESKKDEEKVFHFVNGDTIPTMDSSKATDEYAFQFLGATMEGLYRLGEDGTPVEGIAKSHEVSDDGLTWTFHLRENAKWSNGDPVTAHDFVYAWRRAVDPNTGSEYGPYMMNGVIKNAEEVSTGKLPVEELGVRAEDDYTLVVELANPTPYFESLTTFGTFLPLNEKFVEEKGSDYATSSENLLFNGPYKLEKWKSTSEKWELVKNEDYWDADAVQMDRITFVVLKDTQTRVDLYEKGEVDRIDLASSQVDVYSSHEDFTVIPDTSVFYLKMNQVRNGNKTPLANLNIRKAIMMAFNKDDLVNEILNNGSLVATGLIPKDFVKVPSTGKDFREQNGDLAVYNPDKAKEYWEKGLKELGVDSLELEFLGGDTDTSKVMNEYLANQLEKNLPGLKINLKQVPFEQRLDLDDKQDYDIEFSGWGPDYLDPYTFLSLWVTDGGNNKMGYSNPKYDQLLKDAQTTLALDEDARYENFLEAEKVLFDDAAIAPVYQKGIAQLVRSKVGGVYKNPFGPTYEWKWAYVAD